MTAGRSWISTGSRAGLCTAGLAFACSLVVVVSPNVVHGACAADDFCVNYDKTSSATTGAAASSTLTWNHMMAIGVNRAIVVGVAIRHVGTSRIPTVASITYAGVDLALIDGVTSTDSELRSEIWGLAGDGVDGVAGGDNPVVVTLTGSAEMVAGAVSFTGVDPSTPFNGTSTRGTSATMLSTLAQAGLTSVCVDVTATRSSNSASTVYPDQAQRWNITTGSTSANLLSTGSTRPGRGGRDTYLDWDLGTTAIWATAATEVIPYASTAARLSSFDALAHDPGGATLRWRTGGDRGTLGFRLYREGAGGEPTPVNRELIAGSALLSRATLAAGHSYAWPDPDGAVGDRYWLEEVEVDGGLRRYGPFTAAPAGPADRGLAASPTLRAAAAPATPSVAVPVAAGATHSKSMTTSDLAQQLELAADPSAIRIGVRQRGWYRIDQATLLAAGLNPQADPDRLQVYTSGLELPIRVTGAADGRLDPGDAVELYGLGLDEEATDTRVYWLVEGEEPGLRIAADTTGAVGADLATVPYTVELRERLVYVASFANGDDSNFFGAVLIGGPVERTLQATEVDLGAAATAELEVVLRGFTDGPHQVSVELNGVYVATLTGSNQEEMRLAVPPPPGSLAEGGNLLRLIPGPAGDIALVDVIRLRYPRRSVADADELLAAVPDTVAGFAITGFTEPGTLVLDVSDPFAVSDLTAAAPTRSARPSPGDGTSDGFTAWFRLPPGSDRTIHAVAPGRVLQPAWLEPNQPSSWSTRRAQADVLMVVPRALAPALLPLASYRASQGHRVAVVAVEDVYDERSFGIKRPGAIRDLVADVVDRWRPAPRYLVLVGDASYDPRDFLGFGTADLVPTKFIATDAFEAASDDWFADVDDDGFADLMVGRLPVTSSDELAALVAKTISYDKVAADWSRALFVSDDDLGEQFETSNELFITRLPALEPTRVTVRELGNAGARAAVIDALDAGVDLVSYVGHGSVEGWSGGVLDVAAVDLLAADAPPAVFAMMDCMNGYFFDAALDSLSEALLAAPAGAVAAFAPTGMTAHAPQELMMAAFCDAVASDAAGMTLGEAAAAAKLAAGSAEVRRTWVVLGDPMIGVR